MVEAVLRSEKKTIYLATKSVKVSTIESRIQDCHVLWIAFFKDNLKCRDLEKKLSDRFKRVALGPQLDEIAKTLRGEFVAWIDEISECYGISVD